MEAQATNKNITCPFCSKEYFNVSAKNKHVRNIHKQETGNNNNSHIICPLCRQNKFICGTYTQLQTHLDVSHEIKVEVVKFKFFSKEIYKKWLKEQRIEAKYARCRTRRAPDHVDLSYNCNRSNSIGYESKNIKRREKVGGSWKMYGVCPSRLNIKLYETGEVFVTFWKSHVGHVEEIRCQHLSKADKNIKVEKLVSGVTIDRVISDATKSESIAGPSSSVDKGTKREVEIESLSNFLRSLNDKTYDKCMKQFGTVMEQVSKSKTGKRQMEQQENFPSKRR